MIKKAPDIIAHAKKSQTCIPAESVKSLLASDQQTVIIDVREPMEVQASPVPGAVNIPRGVLEMKVEAAVPEHDRPLLVCCASGGRATLSAKTLQEMGYTNVKVIDCEHQCLLENLKD